MTIGQRMFWDCIRLYFGHPNRESDISAAASRQDCDWKHIIGLASYHCVIPLLRASLLQSNVTLPKDAQRRLDGLFSARAGLSLIYARELARLQLRQNGIRAIVLKGPALAVQLYRSASLRECRDLDILVAKEDLPRAISVLHASGYRLDRSYEGRPDTFQTDKHLLFVHQDTRGRLELHWAISIPSRQLELPFEMLWNNRDEVSVLGTVASVPGRTDLPLILAVHGSSHYWTSLKWVCDVATFLHHYPDINWTNVRKDAKSAGCWRMLLVAIRLALDFTGVGVPTDMQRELAGDGTSRNLADEARGRILSMRALSPCSSSDSFERLFTDIRIRERVKDRLWTAAAYTHSVLTREANRGYSRFPLLVFPLNLARLIKKSWRNLLMLLTSVIAPEDIVRAR
jgi:hypothetical protein